MADGGRDAEPAAADREFGDARHLLSLVAFAFLLAGYWVVRSGGHWADNDSSFMATAIRTVAADGRIAPIATQVYANGYGYQVLSAGALGFTGLDVATLQQYVYPLLSAFVVVPAWLAYRELLGSTRMATVATVLLFVVPGFLFSILRGSHERLDRTFIFVMLWLIVRAQGRAHTPRQSAVHAVLIVTMTYALVATNDLFALATLAAIGLAVVGAWILTRGRSPARGTLGEVVRQLRWVTLAGLAAAVVFMLFIYEPAGHSLRQLLEIPNGILSAVVTGPTDGAGAGPAAPAPTVDPYAGIATRWIHPAVYVALSAGEYLLLGASAVAWLVQGWTLLRRSESGSFGIWLLWLLYAAFALQLAAAVVSDRSGAVATNLQYRSFTILAAVATPIVALWLARIGAGGWPRPLVRGAVALFVVAALLKSTNEPTLSNNWTFYTTAELRALQWADSHQRNTLTWVGIDERLSAAYGVSVGRTQNANRWAFAQVAPTARGLLISDVIRLQTARSGVPLPPTGPHNRVYDNGSVQLYRTRAQAPFER